MFVKAKPIVFKPLLLRKIF